MKHPWILAPLLLAIGDEDAARRAFEAGRFDEARAAYAELENASAGEASAHVSYNRALAAWRAGRWREAEVAAERAAERDPGRFVARRDFLLGNLAFERLHIGAHYKILTVADLVDGCANRLANRTVLRLEIE